MPKHGSMYKRQGFTFSIKFPRNAINMSCVMHSNPSIFFIRLSWRYNSRTWVYTLRFSSFSSPNVSKRNVLIASAPHPKFQTLSDAPHKRVAMSVASESLFPFSALMNEPLTNVFQNVRHLRKRRFVIFTNSTKFT
ncbi:unnamed protein product [Albugo candida]|uniref:Uncharacterized protein n=1 Tax=Albugo candida TaxID=65357 RepID=A0A024GTG2_9STRA|nr:unnamed protein product [Albugo candida]|eukprot:CCI49863.1 unnamed protein product [Albugo candida]